MLQKFPLLITFLFFLSCSTDSADTVEPDTQFDDEVVIEDMPEDEEEDTKTLSIAIQVNGDYFDDLFNTTIFVSDEKGTILESKLLENNVLNKIELEVANDQKYDFTFLERRKTNWRNEITVHLFIDIESGNYVLNHRPINTDKEFFELEIYNTDFNRFTNNVPIEVLSTFDLNFQDQIEENGGTLISEIILPYYPSSFFSSFNRPGDSLPKYFFDSSIQKNQKISQDFDVLPSLNNKITYKIPRLNLSGVNFGGFLENDQGLREYHNIQSYGNKTTTGELFYPEGVFNNFELKISLTCCNDVYRIFEIISYGKPETVELDLPIYEAYLNNGDLNNLSFTSPTNHDYNTVIFTDNLPGNGNIYQDEYIFYVHNLGNSSVIFNKEDLFQNISSETGISAENIKFSRLKLLNNSYSKGAYSKFIQSIIMKKEEYPAGTKIESANFFTFN